MRNKGNKFLALLLMVAVLFTSVPFPAHATEVDVTGTEETQEGFYVEMEPEYFAPETSAPVLSFFGANSSGVSLKESNEVEWIDRIVIPEEVRAFYDILVEGSDNDGMDDFLIEDNYYVATEGDGKIVFRVLGDIVDIRDDAELTAFTDYVYAATVAAFFAFDRDHPEVFWLDGSCLMGRGHGTQTVDGGVQYVAQISFYLKYTQYDFDLRASDYQNQTTIKNAITARDSRVNEIIAPVSNTSNYEKIRHFNEVLTKTNEYNTSDDLNDILHEGRECIGALAGKTGTEGPVCEAYARAFKVLCDEVGIPCVLVDGDANNGSGSGAHMWNYAQLDGAWYAVDVTWNDPMVRNVSGAESGHESEKWLLAGSDTIIEGMTFIASHPVSNKPSSSAPNYTNGPVLNETAYVPTATSEISDVVISNNGTVTFGDTLTVTAKVTSGGLIASNQTLGLYYGDTLLAESNSADMEGIYTLTYDTAEKKVPGTTAQTLTLRFLGSTTTIPIMGAAQKDITVTITPVERTVTFAANSLNAAYTGAVPAVQVLVDGAAYNGSVSYEYLVAGSDVYKAGLPTDAGTYTIKATIPASEDGFYAESTSATATLTIAKSTPTLAINASYYQNAVTYGDGALKFPTEDEITITGAAYDQVVFSWYKGSVADANKLTTAPINAGTYVLKAEIAAGNNNDTATAQKTVVIKAKEITITAKAYEMEYGETLPQNVNMVSVSPALVEGDILTTITLTPSTSSVTTNGTITPSAVVIKNGTEDRTANYNVTYVAGTLTITEESLTGAAVTVAVPAAGYTYDKTAKEPGVTVVLDGTTLVKGTDYTVTYNNNINAGTDTAEVIIKGIGNYSGTITKKFSIAKVVLVPEVTVTSKVYDGTTAAEVLVETDPSNKVLAGDSVVVTGTKGTFASKNAGANVTVLIEAGTISGTNVTNYDVQMPTSATGTITTRPVTVTADAKSKNYGETDPTWTYTIADGTPLVSGETLVGALSRATGENCGTYAIVQNTLTNANNPNYNITFTGAELTIKQVAYTSTVAETQTVLLGDVKFVEPKFTGVNDEAVAGTLTYTYNGTSGLTYANVITYLEDLSAGTDVSVTYHFVPTAGGNYTGTKEGTLTLNVRDIEFLVGDAKATTENAVTVKENPVYGDSWSDIVKINTALVAKRGNESDAEDGHFSLSVTGNPSAGEQSFTVWYNGEIGGKTYTNVVVCSGSIQVAKKSLDVAAGSYKVSKTYDGTTNPGTGSGALKVTGLLTTDTAVVVDVTIGAYTNANVGGQSSMEVTLALSGEGKDNYQLANTKVTVPCEITKKAVTPEIVITGTYTYTGNAITPEFVVRADGVELAETDYAIALSDNVNAGTATISIVEKDGGNYTWNGLVEQTFTILKAVYAGEKTAEVKTRFGNEGSVALADLLPEGAKLGTLSVSDTDAILSTSSLDGTTLKYAIVADEAKVGKTAVVTIPVTETTNYEAFDITVTITASDKLNQEEFALAEETVNKTYGDTDFTVAASGQVEGSTVTYTSSDETVATVDANGKVTILKAGTVTITATASETNDYHEAIDSYTLVVAKLALTWDTTGIYAVDREDTFEGQNAPYRATLFGELAVSGILEVDKDVATFTCPVDKLIGTYADVTSGEKVVTIDWAEPSNPVVLAGEKASNYELPVELPQVVGTINEVKDGVAKVEDGKEYKLEVEEGISSVPESFEDIDKLKEVDTPQKLEEVMQREIQSVDTTISVTDIEVYDVELLVKVDTDNDGLDDSWTKVTANNFPEEGVTVVLPYPEGTSAATHNFRVVHVFTESVGTYNAGDVEMPSVTKTANGIEFKVQGFSPIAVGWSKIPTPPPVEDDDDSDSDYWWDDSAETPVSPKTGDTVLDMICVFLGAVAAIVYVRFRRKNMRNK